MPEDEYVGILIGGLRAGYNVLTNSWALDEAIYKAIHWRVLSFSRSSSLPGEVEQHMQ